MNLSENFTLEELTASSTAKRIKADNTPTPKVMGNLQTLVDKILQPLRNEYARPIIVGSGYRCPAVNKAVGGVSNSDHMYGCAADIHSLSDTPADNKVLFDIAVSLMKKGVIKDVKQIINEYNYNWIHISFQDGRTTKRNQVIAIN